VLPAARAAIAHVSSQRRRVKRPRLLTEALELYRLPRVAIEMSGDEPCRVWYEICTRRHRRWRVIQNKAWGAALLQIPEHFDDFLRGPRRSQLRREMNRALRYGYTFDRVDPATRLDEIMDIHRSAQERQGRPMHPDYLDQEKVRRFLERSAEWSGVFDSAGHLRAYFGFRICGCVATCERVLGHADHLDSGIMYLLQAGVTRELSLTRVATGGPDWLFYDMFSGASPGLRQFKRWTGFEPYRVSWSWRERAGDGLGAARPESQGQ